MQGADANDDDLSTLMPKSVQGLNASPNTENEVQALQEYLELQKQKTQQNGPDPTVTQEVFLPAYNRRRDRLASRRQGSGRPTTARSFGFSGRKAPVDPLEAAANGGDAGKMWPSEKELASTQKAPRPPADENAPPGATCLELLAPVSKQRKTEREERKRKGTGRVTGRRSFGLDLKQLPRKWNGTESESEWIEREAKLAAVRSAQRKQRLATAGLDQNPSETGGRKETGRRGSLAVRKSIPGDNAQPKRKSLAEKRKSVGDSKAVGKKTSPQKMVPAEDAQKVTLDALNVEATAGVNEHLAGENGPPAGVKRHSMGPVVQQEVEEMGEHVNSSEGTMTDGGVDMEIDGSDEEVEGPVQGAETSEEVQPDTAMWTFNPLFAGPDTGEVPQQDKQPGSNDQPASNPRIPPPEALQPALPDKSKPLNPGQTLSNQPLQNLPTESQHFDQIPIETSPQRSQAESNAMRETSASEVKGGERNNDSRGAEVRAAEALGEMNLNQGPEMPAEETPQEEEMEFPALEGSPPPVSPVGTSEDDGHGNGAAEHRLALAIAERKASRQSKAGRPHRNGAGKKNKRLMLLHGRKSLADAGLRTEQGVRRTTRACVRPLEFWRNETVEYERSHDSLPTIARVITLSPDPIWPRPEGRLAARLKQQKLQELGQAEEVLALSLR